MAGDSPVREVLRGMGWPLLGIALGFGVFVVLLSGSARGGAFGRYVLRPVPASVRSVRVESNDWPLNLNPEPVVYVGFQATPEDLAEIVRAKGMRAASGEDFLQHRLGPAWWVPKLREPGTRTFQGSGRRGTETLVIDAGGTNAWFLLWGI